MQPLPHHYRVRARAGGSGEVILSSDGAADLPSQSPPEFGGPPGYWTPESLLVAAIADCFVLTFRAIARARSLAWQALDVEVEGVLEKTPEGIRYTRFDVHARLVIAVAGDVEVATGLLHKAEHSCLISNSLNGRRELHAHVDVAA